VTSPLPRPTVGVRVKDKVFRIGNRGAGWIKRRLHPPSLPRSAADGELRLHLGCGPIDAPGFVNVDLLDAPHVHVQRPLDDLSSFASGCAALVYACHCLEHFGYRHTQAVLQEWTRVLRPGGVLRIAVPDFAVFARAYQGGAPLSEIEGWVMGGQDYRLNFHCAIFDEQLLGTLMTGVGLTDIRQWDPQKVDHHDFVDESSNVFRTGTLAVPLSLNLEGTKR
jgi:SAM-dependent methyltransferase